MNLSDESIGQNIVEFETMHPCGIFTRYQSREYRINIDFEKLALNLPKMAWNESMTITPYLFIDIESECHRDSLYQILETSEDSQS